MGTPRVSAPVLRKFAASQVTCGGPLAKVNAAAIHKRPYRALNACEGNAPECPSISELISAHAERTLD